jgi:hypothetical protein
MGNFQGLIYENCYAVVFVVQNEFFFSANGIYSLGLGAVSFLKLMLMDF